MLEIDATPYERAVLSTTLSGELMRARREGREGPFVDALEGLLTKLYGAETGSRAPDAEPTVITVEHLHDEQVDFGVNGETFLTATHDEHGYAGMDLARRLVDGLGDRLGVRVEVR